MIAVIDNYDSFTFNLVQLLQEAGQKVQIYRNDAISVEALSATQPRGILISPGPCTPNEAGISLNVIEELSGKIPILGICLGHQAFAQTFGGRIVSAKRIMHGKTSQVFHTHTGVFASVTEPKTGVLRTKFVNRRGTGGVGRISIM